MVRIIDKINTPSQDLYQSSQNLFQLLGITINEKPEVIIDFLEGHGIALTAFPDAIELVEAVTYGIEQHDPAFNAELSLILDNQLTDDHSDHFFRGPRRNFIRPGLPFKPRRALVRPMIPPRTIMPIKKPVMPPKPIGPLVKPAMPQKPIGPLVKPAMPTRPVKSVVKPIRPSKPKTFVKPGLPPRSSDPLIRPAFTPINSLLDQVSKELPKNPELREEVKKEAIRKVAEKPKKEATEEVQKDKKKDNRKSNKKTLIIIGSALALAATTGFIIWKVRNKG